MIELTDEQIRAMEAERQPLQVVNPRTKEVFVLIRRDIYDLTCNIVGGQKGKVWDDEADNDLIRENLMNRGHVVQVNWPYSDLSGAKVRPAVVVQADFLVGLVDDTILVKITGTRFGIPGTEVELDPVAEPQSGLSKTCYASCKDILTRDEAMVGPIIGSLSDAAMREIEECLKKVLKLP